MEFGILQVDLNEAARLPVLNRTYRIHTWKINYPKRLSRENPAKQNVWRPIGGYFVSSRPFCVFELDSNTVFSSKRDCLDTDSYQSRRIIWTACPLSSSMVDERGRIILCWYLRQHLTVFSCEQIFCYSCCNAQVEIDQYQWLQCSNLLLDDQ